VLLFLKRKKSSVFYVVSTGHNQHKSVAKNYNLNYSEHAEENAINRLPPKKSKKIENVCILIIRMSKHGKLGMSAPCVHCLKYMKENALEKGYNITDVYYSNADGEIETYKINYLIISAKLHISSNYIDTKYNIEKWKKWREKYINVMT